MAVKKMAPTNCEQCRHYVYNYEEDYYECMINLDEDGWAELLDNLFDIEIDDDNRSSAKTAKHDKIVSDIIDMMESV